MKICSDFPNQGDSEEQATRKVSARPKSAIQKAVEDKLLQLSQLQMKGHEQQDPDKEEMEDDDDANCTFIKSNTLLACCSIRGLTQAKKLTRH
jgi:hypothetical protein